MIKKILSVIMIFMVVINLFACDNWGKYEEWAQKYIDQTGNINNVVPIEAEWWTDGLKEDKKTLKEINETTIIGKSIDENIMKDLENWKTQIHQPDFQIKILTSDYNEGIDRIENVRKNFESTFVSKEVYFATEYLSEQIPYHHEVAYILKDKKKCVVKTSFHDTFITNGAIFKLEFYD